MHAKAAQDQGRTPRVIRHPGDVAACRRLATALRADGYTVLVAADESELEALLRIGAEADLLVTCAEASQTKRRSLVDSLMSWSFSPPAGDDSLVPV